MGLISILYCVLHVSCLYLRRLYLDLFNALPLGVLYIYWLWKGTELSLSC